MTIKTFLSGVDGEKSSKRIGFIATLITAIISSIGALMCFINDKYSEALSIIDSMWLACFGFVMSVASEIIGKFANKKKGQDASNTES